jgi:hypothetical protein
MANSHTIFSEIAWYASPPTAFTMSLSPRGGGRVACSERRPKDLLLGGGFPVKSPVQWLSSEIWRQTVVGWKKHKFLRMRSNGNQFSHHNSTDKSKCYKRRVDTTTTTTSAVAVTSNDDGNQKEEGQPKKTLGGPSTPTTTATENKITVVTTATTAQGASTSSKLSIADNIGVHQLSHQQSQQSLPVNSYSRCCFLQHNSAEEPLVSSARGDIQTTIRRPIRSSDRSCSECVDGGHETLSLDRKSSSHQQPDLYKHHSLKYRKLHQQPQFTMTRRWWYPYKLAKFGEIGHWSLRRSFACNIKGRPICWSKTTNYVNRRGTSYMYSQ